MPEKRPRTAEMMRLMYVGVGRVSRFERFVEAHLARFGDLLQRLLQRRNDFVDAQADQPRVGR